MIIWTLNIASLGLKVGVMELLNLLPVWGWAAKVPIAAGIIEGIGHLAIKHFEDKHPGKLYTIDPDVEPPLLRRQGPWHCAKTPSFGATRIIPRSPQRHAH